MKRLVAIKVIRQDKNALDQGKSRFLQEARAASALNHPNIVQIYELDSQEGEAAAHAAAIVNRDIKPGNVIVSDAVPARYSTLDSPSLNTPPLLATVR